MKCIVLNKLYHITCIYDLIAHFMLINILNYNQ